MNLERRSGEKLKKLPLIHYGFYLREMKFLKRIALFTVRERINPDNLKKGVIKERVCNFLKFVSENTHSCDAKK